MSAAEFSQPSLTLPSTSLILTVGSCIGLVTSVKTLQVKGSSKPSAHKGEASQEGRSQDRCGASGTAGALEEGTAIPGEQSAKAEGAKAQPDQGGERSETARLLLSQDGSWGPPCSRVRIHPPPPSHSSRDTALRRPSGVTINC